MKIICNINKNFEVIIPLYVRTILNVHPGDKVVFKIRNNEVILEKL